jgi:GNAT superfamily N-acetyltransferase
VIRIRTAVLEDADEIAALARDSVVGLSNSYYRATEVQSAAICITTPDLQLILDGTMLVAVDDDLIVGCGGWSKRSKLYTGSESNAEAEVLLDPSKDPARIRAFFVSPTMARRGIGKALYNACCQAAQNAGFSRLELTATLPGVPFYERLGFVSCDPVELPLVDGTALPAVRMSINLETPEDSAG